MKKNLVNKNNEGKLGYLRLLRVYMRILGIETSCDETGIAVYDSHKQQILAHHVYSQVSTHAPFGGVVPELASRDHVQKTVPLIKATLADAELTLKDLDGIAYTKGPGLIGALLCGAMIGRSIAFALNIPAIGVHHLEGHLFAAFLEAQQPAFPFLALLVSGGHTELVQVNGLGDYEILGETLDDAAGEAFDKVGKILGLSYPAGPQLAALAESGQPKRFTFPRPMVNRSGLDFSFSGLKTFALTTSQKHELTMQTKADIALAFEDAVVDTLAIKCKRALKSRGLKRIVVAGGVGANKSLRRTLRQLAEDLQVELFFPRQSYCVDNGAMIAYIGSNRLSRGEYDGLAVEVFPRWPLDVMQS